MLVRLSFSPLPSFPLIRLEVELGNVQRRVGRTIRGMEQHPYRERLSKPCLLGLEKGQLKMHIN